ncbi:MAG: FAD:protein FMN transferase [Desulfobacterota bacterium]|nr:FAD:protein FMN transferase [Thermodesulfobacteriota bacterium]
MPFERSATVLPGGSVLAESGPMRLVISAAVGKVVQTQMALRAAEESFGFLERVAAQRNLLGRQFLKTWEQVKDPLALKMIDSVLAIGDEDLTPMAAVAGTIADEVADFLFARGMTKVVVDNGGDVAIRADREEPMTVGIRPNVNDQTVSCVIGLEPEIHSHGVATSGLGGRSLTRGIASAATVIARTASLADAAATAVANASFLDDEQVFRQPAEEIDPYTDLAGLDVTVKVGPLSEDKKSQAVSQALRRAEDLVRREVILGAFVAVQGRHGMTRYLRDRLIEQA